MPEISRFDKDKDLKSVNFLYFFDISNNLDVDFKFAVNKKYLPNKGLVIDEPCRWYVSFQYKVLEILLLRHTRARHVRSRGGWCIFINF